ncbi:MAG: hypothetical protein Q9205_006461 [Flavoplaca limonia]
MSQQGFRVVDIELGLTLPATETEVEHPPEQLAGYPTFAEFIARDRDAAIYKRFERLSARSLLYQQSELHELEKQLEDFDREDAKDIDDQEAREAAVKWVHYATSTSERAQKRRALHAKIQAKIKEYHEALVLESQVFALSRPASRVLRDFRRAFGKDTMPALWDRDEHLYDNERDLVALAPDDHDRLNMMLKDFFGFLFKSRDQKERTDRQGLFYFPEHRVQNAGLIITTLLSAILLVGAIVSLLYVSERRIKLRVAILVLFTCVFAGVVGLLTNAKRAEIFMSTAAYAAVLVVFIGNIKID